MRVSYYGNPDSGTVLIQMVNIQDLGNMDREMAAIGNWSSSADFLLAAVEVDQWNTDLSPWQAPPVFGKEAFGAGAEDTLSFLQREVLPSLAEQAYDGARTVFLGGYSLAGLFALWSACRTEQFAGIAAVSPSVWFPDFRKYMAAHPVLAEAVYLSLGEKEEKTRSPVMSQVGDSIRQIHVLLQKQAVSSVLEWNPGNHFREPDLRMAKGFAWLINHCLRQSRTKM